MEASPPRGSPPSTYAILAAVEGQPGAWRRVAVATAIRSGMIAPGLWVAGIRGWRLVLGSLAGSVGISAILYGYYALIRARQVAAAPATAVAPSATADTSTPSGSSLN